MTRPPLESPAALTARVDAALAARRRLDGVPLRVRIAALAAAARRFEADVSLRTALVESTGLSPAMVAAVVPLAAAPLAVPAMTALVARELGSPDASPPAAPAVVLHVLASNVPALALPAIALGVLAGAVVVVKSGRDDVASAPAFVRALEAELSELAATVVTAYWPGGDAPLEDVALARADVVVLTGGDVALAALAPRVRGRLVVHGPRASVAAVAREALADADGVADAIARDVALHDQRGCLSPHAVYVEEGGTLGPRDFAGRLVAALEGLRRELPPGRARVEERATVRVAWDAAELEPETLLVGGPGAGAIVQAAAPFRPGPGGRTLRVHPLPDLAVLPAWLPAGAVECVGLAGGDAGALADALRARGVARLCPVGRMQRPGLAWPRGQRAPLGALLGRVDDPRLEVEA